LRDHVDHQNDSDKLMSRHKGGFAAWLSTAAVLFCALIPSQIRAQPVWNALPPVSAAFIDREGTLWLARENPPTAPSREWWRLSLRGEVLARLSFPRHLTLLDAWNDRLLGTLVDELGMTSIVVYRLAPGRDT
jgi:hypothetical protein